MTAASRTRAALLPLVALVVAILIGTLIASPEAHGQPAPAQPRVIRVLWYSYAHPESPYRRAIDRLAENAHRLPKSAGYRWQLAWFGPEWPAPAFDRYDVLVIQSGEGFYSARPGAAKQAVDVDFSGILKHGAAIARARGSRTVLTGSDADLHALVGDTGHAPTKGEQTARCNPPLLGPACWDGAVGHLVNAINWAGSGQGMGIVSLVAAEFPGSDWWLHRDSFLREELSALAGSARPVVVFGPGTRERDPEIPPPMRDHPLNAGITSRGLSFRNAFHAGFSRDIPGYVPFVNSTRHPGLAVALARDRAGLK